MVTGQSRLEPRLRMSDRSSNALVGIVRAIPLDERMVLQLLEDGLGTSQLAATDTGLHFVPQSSQQDPVSGTGERPDRLQTVPAQLGVIGDRSEIIDELAEQPSRSKFSERDRRGKHLLRTGLGIQQITQRFDVIEARA